MSRLILLLSITFVLAYGGMKLARSVEALSAAHADNYKATAQLIGQ